MVRFFHVARTYGEREVLSDITLDLDARGPLALAGRDNNGNRFEATVAEPAS